MFSNHFLFDFKSSFKTSHFVLLVGEGHMNNKIAIGAIITILIIVIAAFGVALMLNTKDALLGTWHYSDGGTITFNDDNTVNINDIGPLGDLDILGIFDYSVANDQITFTSGSVSVTLTYSIPNSNTLILSNDTGLSLTLTK